MIKKYRKIQVEVDAIQWTGENFSEVSKFCFVKHWDGAKVITLRTSNGDVFCLPGDYVLLEPGTTKGDAYPCSPRTFKQNYEEVK